MFETLTADTLLNADKWPSKAGPAAGVYNLSALSPGTYKIPSATLHDAVIIIAPHITLDMTSVRSISGCSSLVSNGGRFVFSPDPAIQDPPPLENATNPGVPVIAISPNDIIKPDVSLNEGQLVALTKGYPGLDISREGTEKVLLTHCITENDKQFLRQDLAFLKVAPNLPAENICCRLDTYRPRNDSQTSLKMAASQFVNDFLLGERKGMIAYGSAGIGKTHISISIAKSAMTAGAEVIFLTPETYTQNRSRLDNIDGSQVIIFDDLNEPYHPYMGVFLKTIVKIHERGGHVFVTTNAEPTELFGKGLNSFAGGAESERVADRIKGLFSVVPVYGSSYRKSAGEES